jgi:hypothetical protein
MAEHCHSVVFYDHDAHVDDHLARHVSGALEREGTALVIATEPRRARLFQGLRFQGLTAAALEAGGRLAVLDAGETLSQIMLGGAPAKSRLENVISPHLERVGRGPVAAFGEMVALL